MSGQSGLQSLETSVHKTHDWLNEMSRLLELPDKQHALNGLRSSLHVLRDRLPVELSAHLAAQLPILIRGLYFEGWRPSEVPKKIRSKEDFIDALRDELSSDRLDARAEDVARATFEVIARHVSKGETDKVRASLPKPLRELWPPEVPAPAPAPAPTTPGTA